MRAYSERARAFPESDCRPERSPEPSDELPPGYTASRAKGWTGMSTALLGVHQPRVQQRTTTGTNAPVNVCVYKVTDQAGDLWANFKDTDAKLFQIQMEHDARQGPSNLRITQSTCLLHNVFVIAI